LFGFVSLIDPLSSEAESFNSLLNSLTLNRQYTSFFEDFEKKPHEMHVYYVFLLGEVQAFT